MTFQQGTDAPDTLTGEWGGLRTRLRDDGLDLAAGYVSETAWNASGGMRERVVETGQFSFAATIDTAKLIGLTGGTFQGTITFRRGHDLGADAGLGVLQQVQEVYGRGQTWRLTQLWYQQTFAEGRADIKIGRLTQGEDFAAFSCQLQNLSFCGSPPGNLAGDYWYNWPISQWGVRGRLRNDRFYAMVGAYEVNPRNLENAFTFGRFHGATGVLIPAEIGFTPRLGASRLPGSYRFGGWYNTAEANDVGLDINGNPQAVTGLAPLRRTGRYGFYLQLQQQLSGSVEEGKAGPKVRNGLIAYLNITQTDRHTTVTDNQVAAGLTYAGLIPFRPHDDVTFAVARTNVNANALLGLAKGQARPDAEYAAEFAYCIHTIRWLTLRPNLQYVVNPGGFTQAKDVVVLGLKASVAL
ncbi:carbohydrate porin [Sphingomonas glacialis]|uniref:carbohydrate porin n=1 Tax=Sphingomonas glacialis TaxID=658225 RepID=UPI00138756EE|nr:carbohydrate porin [Sphingomonas glacialis]